MGIEATDIEVMLLTFFLSLQANALNAFPAEEDGKLGCDISSLAKDMHWRMLDLPHFSALDEGHYSDIVTAILIAFHQHVLAIKSCNQPRKFTMQF